MNRIVALSGGKDSTAMTTDRTPASEAERVKETCPECGGSGRVTSTMNPEPATHATQAAAADKDDSPGEICVADYDEWRAFQAWKRAETEAKPVAWILRERSTGHVSRTIFGPAERDLLARHLLARHLIGDEEIVPLYDHAAPCPSCATQAARIEELERIRDNLRGNAIKLAGQVVEKDARIAALMRELEASPAGWGILSPNGKTLDFTTDEVFGRRLIEHDHPDCKLTPLYARSALSAPASPPEVTT